MNRKPSPTAHHAASTNATTTAASNESDSTIHWTAFEGYRLLAEGTPLDVARVVKARVAQPDHALLLVFDADRGLQVDIDLRGSDDDLARWVHRITDAYDRFAPPLGNPDTSIATVPRRGPGRPALGVTAREVTLLPRHWEWLNAQPGGASAAIRRLVDQARGSGNDTATKRQRLERVYRVMSSLAGNLPWFEEVTRAMYASNEGRFVELVREWPEDVASFIVRIAQKTFDGPHPATSHVETSSEVTHGTVRQTQGQQDR